MLDKKNGLFGMGVKVVKDEDAGKVDLGPLKDLQGTWKGCPGWNVIAVPGPLNNGGPGGFIFEVIPYEETWKFTPVVVAGNRGLYTGQDQEVQQIAGLMYEQTITSICFTDLCKKMGFYCGTEIHAETGLFLNVRDCIISDNTPTCKNAEFNVARLSTIPHGNSLLALGTSKSGVPVGHDFIGSALSAPRPVNPHDSFFPGYTEQQYQLVQQFPEFNQMDPNTFLKETIKDQTITAMTTIEMSTKNKSGGILNIPYIEKNIKATDMEAIFWIQQVAGLDSLQLQYTQTINLVFPGIGITGKPIPVIWPHITVNTLRKV